MRISALASDSVVVRVVMARAGEFDGRVPLYSYAAIARNLKRRRGVKLSAKAVMRLVRREDRALERRRARAPKRGRPVRVPRKSFDV